MKVYDEKYQQKLKSISSAEPNYFVHFATRYPVIKPRRIEHLQSQEPFSSDPYFSRPSHCLTLLLVLEKSLRYSNSVVTICMKDDSFTYVRVKQGRSGTVLKPSKIRVTMIQFFYKAVSEVLQFHNSFSCRIRIFHAYRLPPEQCTVKRVSMEDYFAINKCQFRFVFFDNRKYIYLFW